MKNLNTCLAILAASAMLSPLAAFASAKTKHSVTLGDPVIIGSTQLKPGNYHVEWQGSGPAVQVNFLRNGKTVATAPATLKTNDQQVTQDDVIMGRTKANMEKLNEIDFAHQKEALVFTQSGM